MVRARALVLLAAAVSTLAAPQLLQRDEQVTGGHAVATRADINTHHDSLDTDVLQYALTLEHLENAFYTEGLDKLDEQAFADAGYPPWVRARFEQIKGHEATHVQVLSAALGDVATKPCTYNL